MYRVWEWKNCLLLRDEKGVHFSGSGYCGDIWLYSSYIFFRNGPQAGTSCLLSSGIQDPALENFWQTFVFTILFIWDDAHSLFGGREAQ